MGGGEGTCLLLRHFTPQIDQCPHARLPGVSPFCRRGSPAIVKIGYKHLIPLAPTFCDKLGGHPTPCSAKGPQDGAAAWYFGGAAGGGGGKVQTLEGGQGCELLGLVYRCDGTPCYWGRGMSGRMCGGWWVVTGADG